MSIHNNTKVKVLLERLKEELRTSEKIKKEFYKRMLMLISSKVVLPPEKIIYLESILLSIKFDNEFLEIPPEAEGTALTIATQLAQWVNCQYMIDTK